MNKKVNFWQIFIPIDCYTVAVPNNEVFYFLDFEENNEVFCNFPVNFEVNNEAFKTSLFPDFREKG